jgi:hypothetical protein
MKNNLKGKLVNIILIITTKISLFYNLKLCLTKLAKVKLFSCVVTRKDNTLLNDYENVIL